MLPKHYILSIDLGIKNLGFAIIEYSQVGVKNLTDLLIDFSILNIESKFKRNVDIVNNRCNVLKDFFLSLKEKYTTFDTIIVERQVNRNTMAMELMYATAMAVKIIFNTEPIIFDPKDKFLKLNIEYTTANKAHKKKSILFAQTLINRFWVDKIESFNSFDKKDDIADAINQALVWMYDNHLLNDYKTFLLE